MNHKQLVIQLHQLADFISGNRFRHYFDSNNSQFDTDVTPIYNKLRRDIRGAVLSIMTSQQRGDQRDQSITAASIACAIPSIIELADKIAARYNVITTKKERQFTIKRGDNLERAIERSFGLIATSTLCQPISAIDTPQRPIYSTDTSNLICRLGAYITASYTLKVPHQNTKYNKMLLLIIKRKGTKYFEQGYPLDMLAYDAIEAKRDDLVYIRTNNDYCSTLAVYSKPISNNTHTDYKM